LVEALTPPRTRTVPSPRTVKVVPPRGVLIEPVGLQFRLFRLKSSLVPVGESPAMPAAPVATNVTGLPTSVPAVAVAELVPRVGPNVKVVELRPWLSVVTVL